MIVRQGYRYRLKTTPEIEHQLRVQAGHCRFVWNEALRLNLARLEQGVPLLWYADLCGLAKLWKATDERSFLREAHSQALQQTLRNQARAFQDAFDPTQPNKRLPRFKKKGVRDSFRYPQGFQLGTKRIYLPKVGWVGYFDSRPIEGAAKNVTVSLDAGHWYVSVQTERELPEPVHPSTSVEGIDAGVAAFAATAAGELIAPVNAFKSAQAKLARLQRTFSRRVKFSANWRKAKAKINRVHHKIACIRADFLHKLSTALSQNHAMIAVEDLRIQNMSASAKGTVEAPGKNVKAKSGLNRAILDQGWGEFRRQLDYKLARLGGQLVKVAPAYTSQRCSQCGHTAAGNRPSQAVFACTACHFSANADINAARNILIRGLVTIGMIEDEARRFVRNTKATRPQGMGLKPVEGNAAGHPSKTDSVEKQEPWEIPVFGIDNTTHPTLVTT